MHLLIVIGTRPNFIKVTRFRKVMDAIPGAKLTLVHTGQHYDPSMSQVFFDELSIPEPVHNLAVSGGPHGQMTGRMLERLEAVIDRLTPEVQSKISLV